MYDVTFAAIIIQTPTLNINNNMKKLLFFAVVTAAFTFTSCDNKKTDATDQHADSAAVEVVDEGVEMTNQLTEAIEANDANKLETALNDVKSRLGELDAEKAKGALAAVQNFLKENAEKVTALVGGNTALQTLVNGVTNMTDEGLSALGAAKKGAENAAENVVEDAKNKAEQTVNEVKKDVEDVKQNVDKKVQEVKDAPKKAVDNVREQGRQAVDKTAEKVKGML